jgi:putative hydrolase of the HAD superfamily
MPRAIVFDLFETLITESGVRAAGVSSSASLFGCEREPFRREWKLLRPAVVLGRLSFREALKEIAARIGGRTDDTALWQVYEDRIRVKAVPFGEIDDEIIAMLDQLRRRGLRLGIISNCFAEDVTAWPRSALASHTDAAVFSFEAGLAKPDPEIYREAMRRLDVDPSDAWYVGDGADDELSGAAHAGMRALQSAWFLKRWPHFQDVAGSLTSVDEVVRIVDAEDRRPRTEDRD